MNIKRNICATIAARLLLNSLGTNVINLTRKQIFLEKDVQNVCQIS